ncbi:MULTISPECIES: sialidase family protein [unclassified Crossiella]|uniref:sialidase family protein n=1 Tax=unclassified Crossiella TaxID=2620835 RepID=UPI001FFE903C|nr:MULTISPECIES: sialidase family protein [unclassified Crossiella]MCK2244486.1 glycoside hydrolase [Crossiella sp. S99.2]MCK2258117.1 glycoside hydrolase [Crossiella sp. S99.1]
MTNPTRFARRLVIATAATAVLASAVAVPKAVAADPGITPEQLSTALFSAAVQLKDNGRTHDRNLLLSAELLDWRAKNPGASADALDRHAADVQRVVGLAVAPATARDLVPDTLGRGVEALYAIPEVDRGGPQLKVLLGALTTRDLKATSAPEDLRGVLTQITSSSIEIAPTIWSALREAASRDATLNGIWQNRLGKATVAESAPVDPAASLDALKQLPQIKKVIDVEAIQAGFRQGFPEGMAALTKQIKPLIKVLGDPNSPDTPLGKALAWVKEHVDPVTGEIKRPTEDKLKQYAEDAKQFDEYLDKVKGGLTAVATVAKVLSPRYAAELVKFADALYKIGKHVAPMINAVAALGTAIAAGAAIGSIVPAIGTVIGAAVGLVVTLVGLLGSGGGPSAELQAIQNMHKEMRESFKQLKDFLIAFHQDVSVRFDRIDATLNLMYGDMLLKFDEVLLAIANSNFQLTQQIKDLHAHLLGIASNMQSNHQQLMAAVQADGAKDFRGAVRKYLDYAAREGRPIPSFDQGNDNYKEAAQAFSDGGDDLARTALFMHNGQDAAPESVLPGNNSTFLVNYLKTWAVNNVGAQYGNGHPGSGVPNADLLAAAMRSYSTLMNQNPALSAQEQLVELNGKKTVARVQDLLNAGEDVIAATRRFNQPRFKPATGPWTATNSLLERVQQDNAARLTELANGLKRYESDPAVQEPGRPFNLWADRNQRVEGFMKRDDVPVYNCDNPNEATKIAVMPDAIKSDKMPAPLRLLRQLHSGMDPRTCWREVRVRDDETTYERYPLDGPTRIPCEWAEDPPVGCTKTVHEGLKKMVRLNVTFEILGRIPGYAGEWQLGRHTGVIAWERCRFPGVDWAADEPKNDKCWNSRAKLEEMVPKPPRYDFTGAMSEVHTDTIHPLIDKTLAGRRAAYYGLITNDVKDATPKLPEAVRVDTSLRLLRAYLEVGFPTALQSDARFRELIYGTKAIPSSLNVRPSVANEISPLAGLYAKAAQNAAAQLPPLHEQNVFSQSELPNCAAAPEQVTTQDPVARCLVTVSGLRRGALGERIEYYSTDLVTNPAAQDPQITSALMRSLRIQTKATHPDYPLDPPGEPNPVPPTEIGKTFGGLGGSARATLNGKHFMVWQGRQDEVLVATSEDGKAWWPPVTVSGPHTSGDVPVLAAFQNKLVAIWRSGAFSWQDGNNDRTLAIATSADGRTWTTPARLVPITVGTGGLSLSVQNDRLQLLFRGAGADQGKWITSSHDAKNWKRPRYTENNGGTNATPGLATLNGTLVQLWRGANADQALWFATSGNGIDWSNQQLLPNAFSQSGPSLTEFTGKVFAVWRNGPNDGLSVSDTANGGAWAAPRALHAQARAVGVPSLGVVGGKLAAIWRNATDPDRVDVSTSTDGITWSAPEPISKLTFEIRHQHNESLITEATQLWARNEREAAVAKAKQALVLARELVRERPSYAATFGQWIRHPVGPYLSESGKVDESIALYDEAIAAFRKLSQQEPQNLEHKLYEAATVVVQGSRIWDKGEKDKGRDRSLEGVNLARPLVSKGPRYAADFATWIRWPVSAFLAETGKVDEAIALLGEAVTASRQAAQQEPDNPEHKRDEADALVWQGNRLWHQGEKGRGLDKALEGINVARPLVAKGPRYASHFATWIRWPVSAFLAESGKPDEAIALLGEAVTAARQAGQQEPGNHEHKLNEADALVWQGIRTWDKGEKDKGRDKALEGVNVGRALVDKGPRYASHFATWIRWPVSAYLAETGKLDESIALLGEAVTAERQAAQQEPGNHEHKLNEADALMWQGIRTWDKGDKPGALAKVQEGLVEGRKVADKGPRYAEPLGTWLLWPGTEFAMGNGKKPEAIAMAQEAVDIFTRLTAADAKYQPKLDSAKQKLTELQR